MAKKGHVFFRRGRFVGTYTPRKTRDWEKVVADHCRIQKPKVFPTGGVLLKLSFSLMRSKSNKSVHHTIRPDIDNLVKSVLDGMQGIFFKDDSQIIDISANKFYSCSEGVMVYFQEYKKENIGDYEIKVP